MALAMDLAPLVPVREKEAGSAALHMVFRGTCVYLQCQLTLIFVHNWDKTR